MGSNRTEPPSINVYLHCHERTELAMEHRTMRLPMVHPSVTDVSRSKVTLAKSRHIFLSVIVTSTAASRGPCPARVDPRQAAHRDKPHISMSNSNRYGRRRRLDPKSYILPADRNKPMNVDLHWRRPAPTLQAASAGIQVCI